MKATYFCAPYPPRELEVLRTHKDGTVDIGTKEDGKEVEVVTKCPVSKEPANGKAVITK